MRNNDLINTTAVIVNRYSSKNLLPNYTGSTEINGVTFTVRDDGSILINGTATNSIWYNFCYIDFGSDTMNTWDHSYSATNGLIISSGNPNICMQYEGGNKATYIAIGPGVTINNQIAYPMIRDARIKDDAYAPYSMTNKELTERVIIVDVPIDAVTLVAGETANLNISSVVPSGYSPASVSYISDNNYGLCYSMFTEFLYDSWFLLFQNTTNSSATLKGHAKISMLKFE